MQLHAFHHVLSEFFRHPLPLRHQAWAWFMYYGVGSIPQLYTLYKQDPSSILNQEYYKNGHKSRLVPITNVYFVYLCQYTEDWESTHKRQMDNKDWLSITRAEFDLWKLEQWKDPYLRSAQSSL